MRGEISRRSYVDFMNRMQVVVETDDGKTHVFNFSNANSSGHSHIVYKNGYKDYSGTYDSRDCYEHDYNGFRFDYYNAERVSSFPYTFEQVSNLTLDSLTEEQNASLEEYLSTVPVEKPYSLTRKINN